MNKRIKTEMITITEKNDFVFLKIFSSAPQKGNIKIWTFFSV